MNFQELQESIKERFQLDSLAPHGEKGVSFVANGSVQLFLELDGRTEETVLYTTLGTVPREGREELLSTLLRANLFGTLTYGAVFAVEPKEELIVLSYRLPRDLHGDQEFFNLLERFLGVHNHWMQKLEESRRA